MSYKLLDKITLYITNFDKETTIEAPENIGFSCSGSPSPSWNANECDEYIIYKIVETKETEFSFETVLDYYGDVEKEHGVNEFKEVKYHLMSLDKKIIVCDDRYLKSLSSEYRKKSYENHLKQIK